MKINSNRLLNNSKIRNGELEIAKEQIFNNFRKNLRVKKQKSIKAIIETEIELSQKNMKMNIFNES